ncbi:PhnA Zinc-Ribbon [Seinonella peptonophila]|uniref:PhnA Zinc-Ribbon n=1 Tax=Seinonella peptonophila TaxID=112248 RepID=A0A1M4X6V5_9BACL|nr:hypothetical protein [Seinonella peptonophila]SHE88822.1 PhnA Zinc-Ribbon [Seinonella peptonophila]
MKIFEPSVYIYARFFWGGDGHKKPKKCPRCGSDVIKEDDDRFICHNCDHRWIPN